jgi:osmotically-inducible protein OsmY
MVRGLLKLVLLTGVLAAAGTYLAGWWEGRDVLETGSRAVATTGVDSARARQIGAQVKERTVEATRQTRRTVTAGGLTAKIKAKMALDDVVKALDLDVDTSGTIVTVSGRVRSDAERQRALRLARETDGVTKVIDRIQVQQPGRPGRGE